VCYAPAPSHLPPELFRLRCRPMLVGTIRGFFRRLILVAIAALAVAVPRMAGAALMNSYDIASLAYEAEEIVLVEKVQSWQPKDQLRDVETVRVQRSYDGGPHHVGAELTIETSCYGFEPMYGWNREGKPTPVVSDERILFLRLIRKDGRTVLLDSGAP